ncbi:MAG: type II toxin-antitoxin system HicB family antitoxin [Elusimicrobia bacterium]|nr:type II toxin-antitoxin system HicB family antitoxin [Elusimicrobiota bacterium]
MKKYSFPVVIEKDEDGWYVGLVPDLKGCHTQARSLNELDKRLKEAIKLCLATEKKSSVYNTFIGVHQVEVAA